MSDAMENNDQEQYSVIVYNANLLTGWVAVSDANFTSCRIATIVQFRSSIAVAKERVGLENRLMKLGWNIV